MNIIQMDKDGTSVVEIAESDYDRLIERMAALRRQCVGKFEITPTRTRNGAWVPRWSGIRREYVIKAILSPVAATMGEINA
jgi:hypothetical protein